MMHEFWLEVKGRNLDELFSELPILKMDLKGASTLLSFRGDDMGLFAMLLTGDLVNLQLAGIFGWSGTTAAFQVVTRAIS